MPFTFEDNEIIIYEFKTFFINFLNGYRQSRLFNLNIFIISINIVIVKALLFINIKIKKFSSLAFINFILIFYQLNEYRLNFNFKKKENS